MTKKNSPALKTAVILLSALPFLACDSDSPTAPSVTPTAAPQPTTSATWSVSVTASPSSIGAEELAAGTNSSTITVRARRADNNQPPPAGATAVLSATAGILVNSAGTVAGSSIPVAFDRNGQAQATLNLPAQVIDIVVRAQLEENAGQTTVRILEAPVEAPLFIEAVIPSNGPPSGGTRVRIEGSGFDPPARVSFGGQFADVLSVSSNVITALTPPRTVPVGTTATVPVTVSINVNDTVDTPAADTLANAFTYARAGQILPPSIISVSPTSGPNEGGTQVAIFGENFSDQVQVLFGTSALIEAPILSVSPTRIVVETPSATGPNAVHLNSIVNVRVINLTTGAVAELAGAFQYGAPGGGMFISSAGPTEGYYFGGLNVTIFGQGFEEPVAVEFGGLGQQKISVTGTEIIARSVPVEIVACNRPSGPFGVTNIETNETADSGIIFTYRPVEPVIFGIAPNEIQVILNSRETIPANARATISGGGFDFPVRVTFGPETSATFADAVVPDPAFDPRHGIGSAFDVIIPRYLDDFPEGECTDALGNAGTIRRPVQVDVRVENAPTECDDTLLRGFTYIPVLDAAGTPVQCVVDGSAPTASFSSSAEGLTVTFTDTSTGDPDTWQWDFGDGVGTSTAQSPVYTYAAPGTYEVTLVASNTFGTSDPFSQVLTVDFAAQPPVASFVFSIDGLAVTFTDTSTGGPTQWSWSFGDSGTSAVQNPFHVYAAPGIYEVSLVATNATGSSAPFIAQLVLEAAPGPPVADFSFTVQNLTVSFTDLSTGDPPLTWLWNFGDGEASTLQNPIHTYPPVAMTYTVMLTVTNALGSNSLSADVTVAP